MRVVTSTLCPFAILYLIRSCRSSICPSVGSTWISGSTSPVGRIICSALFCSCWASYGPGVADTYTIWFTLFSNSSKFRGRLSIADGSLNP